MDLVKKAKQMLEVNGGEYSSRAPMGASNYSKNPDMLPLKAGYVGEGYNGTNSSVVAAKGLYSGGNKLSLTPNKHPSHPNGVIGPKTGHPEHSTYNVLKKGGYKKGGSSCNKKGGYKNKKGGSSCNKLGGSSCNIKVGGRKHSMRKVRKLNKSRKHSMRKSRKHNMRKGRKHSMKGGRKHSMRKSRKHNMRKSRKHSMKGGNKQPFSNKPLSFSYGLNADVVNPKLSALANPMPFVSMLNCQK
jgi:hypothetical protein